MDNIEITKSGWCLIDGEIAFIDILETDIGIQAIITDYYPENRANRWVDDETQANFELLKELKEDTE